MTETFIQSAPSVFCTLTESTYIEIIKDLAPSIIGFLSLVLAVFIHFKTTRFTRHFERPLISIDKTEVRIEEGGFEDGLKFKYPYNIVSHNQGKRPASDVSITTLYMYPNDKVELNRFESPNKLYQDKKSTSSGNIFSSHKLSKEAPVLIAIKIQYKDYLEIKNKFNNEWFWYKFIGGGTFLHPTVEEKKLMQQKLKKDGYIV